MNLTFRYTILYVKDVPTTLKFYEDAFGLKTEMLHEGGDYGQLSTGQTKLAFCSHSLLQTLGKSPQSPDATHPVFEIAFETEDVESAFQRAVEAGAKAVQAPRRESWGQTTSYVLDTNGFLVELCSPVGAVGD